MGSAAGMVEAAAALVVVEGAARTMVLAWLCWKKACSCLPQV